MQYNYRSSPTSAHLVEDLSHTQVFVGCILQIGFHWITRQKLTKQPNSLLFTVVKVSLLSNVAMFKCKIQHLKGIFKKKPKKNPNKNPQPSPSLQRMYHKIIYSYQNQTKWNRQRRRTRKKEKESNKEKITLNQAMVLFNRTVRILCLLFRQNMRLLS